jgi:enamine deaminase RidA (YjgF/YER057c/UK114 family)
MAELIDTSAALLAAAPMEPPVLRGRQPVEAVTRLGDLLVASGQVAVADNGLVATGVVGTDVDLATARRAAWVCARNVLAAVRDEAGGLDQVRAVRITVYVACGPTFTEQHLVADAATRLVLDVLGPERGAHSRAALGVASLPLGSPVEVDGLFRLVSGQTLADGH